MNNNFHHNSIYDECSVDGRALLKGMPLPIQSEKLFSMKCHEVIDTLELDFYEGNCFKYIWRLGRKDTVESDLSKIHRYAVASVERKTVYEVFYKLLELLNEQNDIS